MRVCKADVDFALAVVEGNLKEGMPDSDDEESEGSSSTSDGEYELGRKCTVLFLCHSALKLSYAHSASIDPFATFSAVSASPV